MPQPSVSTASLAQQSATPPGAATGRPSVPLATLRTGQVGRLCDCGLDAQDAALLRAMGLREAATIRVCRDGEPCIVTVQCHGGDGCRIGLARPLAHRLMVDVLGSDA